MAGVDTFDQCTQECCAYLMQIVTMRTGTLNGLAALQSACARLAETLAGQSENVATLKVWERGLEGARRDFTAAAGAVEMEGGGDPYGGGRPGWVKAGANNEANVMVRELLEKGENRVKQMIHIRDKEERRVVFREKVQSARQGHTRAKGTQVSRNAEYGEVQKDGFVQVYVRDQLMCVVLARSGNVETILWRDGHTELWQEGKFDRILSENTKDQYAEDL